MKNRDIDGSPYEPSEPGEPVDSSTGRSWRGSPLSEELGRPTCGHSVCSQNFIETGEVECVQLSAPEPTPAFRWGHVASAPAVSLADCGCKLTCRTKDGWVESDFAHCSMHGAAREMFEALEDIARQAGAGCGSLDEGRLGVDGAAGDFEWIIDEARAAIAKAKGVQP